MGWCWWGWCWGLADDDALLHWAPVGNITTVKAGLGWAVYWGWHDECGRQWQTLCCCPVQVQPWWSVLGTTRKAKQTTTVSRKRTIERNGTVRMKMQESTSMSFILLCWRVGLYLHDYIDTTTSSSTSLLLARWARRHQANKSWLSR